MSMIYRKTVKGQTEVETRAHRLPPRLRAALIIIDGRRPSDELLKLMPTGAAEALAQLHAEGFIEETAVPAPVTAPAPLTPLPTQPGALPGGTVTVNFEQRRRDAVRALADLVGPMGEALALKMERARNASELRPYVETAVQVIANTRGRQAAVDFARRFGD